MKKIIKKINDSLMMLIAMGTPSCEVIGEKISKSFDRPLTIKERWQVKIHLIGCKFCLRYRDQLIKLHRMASNLNKNFEDYQKEELKLDDEIKLKIKENIKKQKNIKK